MILINHIKLKWEKGRITVWVQIYITKYVYVKIWIILTFLHMTFN